jgi:mercuric ion transport protein
MQERTEPSPVASSRRGWASLLSLGLTALTCPCHLPLVIVLFAGSTLGAWTSQHRVVLTLVMLGVFVVSLLYGLGGLSRQGIAGDATNRAARSIPTREKSTQSRRGDKVIRRTA